MPLGVTDQARRIGEAVARDELPELVDELERPAEADRVVAVVQPHA